MLHARIVGTLLEYSAVDLCGGLEIAHDAESDREHLLCRLRTRPQRERFGIALDAEPRLAPRHVQIPVIVPRFDVFSVQLERAVISACGVFQATLSPVHDAEIAECRSSRRAARYCLLVSLDGFVDMLRSE